MISNASDVLWRLESCSEPNATLTNLTSQVESPLYVFYKRYVHLHGYIALAVCIIGVVANAANIVVLTRRNMLTPTNRILTWLAIADFITMAVYIPQVIHYYVVRDIRIDPLYSTYKAWIYYSLVMLNLVIVFHSVACWLTVALAFFRYIYIAFPALGSSMVSTTRINWTTGIIHVAVFILGIPNAIINKVEECRTEATLDHGALRTFRITQSPNMSSFNTANFVICGFFFKIIPCMLLTLLTLLLIVEMSRATARRKRLASNKSTISARDVKKAKQETRTTAMLLTIVVFFLALETPQGVLMICAYLVPNFYKDIYINLGDIIDMLSLLNNTVNFVLYTSMSSQFRQAFVDVFCGVCLIERSNRMSLSHGIHQNQERQTAQKHRTNEKTENALLNDEDKV